MIIFDFTMLDGDISMLQKILSQSEYTYPDILKITGEFRISINGNVFFLEPYFPVLEFLKYALVWIDCSDKSKEMSYSSMETEDNPLLLFKKEKEGWIVCSPWQKYKCLVSFSRDELTYAVLHLLETLSNSSNNEKVY